MVPEKLVLELERLLGQVNAELQRILPSVQDPAFTDSDVRKAIQSAERLSRWKRTLLPDDPSGLDYAKTRAEAKAKEHGESFVVVEPVDGSTLVVVSKGRLLRDKPFGLDIKDVVYETSKATA